MHPQICLTRHKDLLEADPSLLKAANDARVASVAKAGEALRAAISALGQKIEIIEDGSVFRPVALPVMTVRGDRRALTALGRHHRVQVVDRALRDTPEVPASGEFYFPVSRADAVRQAGWHGTNIVVAHFEGPAPDSWVNLVPSGPCDAEKCACPGGVTSAHPRESLSIVRNSITTYHGVADGVTVIVGNSDGDIPACTGVNAFNFVASKGATVINRPVASGGNTARYLDYLATEQPYPLIAVAAGNDCNYGACDTVTTVRNALSVQGAITDDAIRSHASVYVPGKWINPQGPGLTWELPHVAASAGNRVVGNIAGQTYDWGGTSSSTPVVAGIVAQLQEANPVIKLRPEAQIAGILVGADENLDEAFGGTWPLNVMDGIDDRDGVGLINAWNSMLVLAPTAKVNGGNVAATLGHDYGQMWSSSTPAGTYYTETYHALVPPGTTLRAAAILMATACYDPLHQPPDTTNCATESYPLFRVELREEGGLSSAVSANYSQNYQFASINNTRFPTTSKWYTIKIYLQDWPATTSSYWAVAWQAS